MIMSRTPCTVNGHFRRLTQEFAILGVPKNLSLSRH